MTQQLDENATRAAHLTEYATLDDQPLQTDLDQLTGTDVPNLLDEIRALRSERDELRGKFAAAAASLAEQVLRYGQRQREHNADREELEQLRTALTQIRHLHKDSPMDPCPLCIDADAAAAGGDGLVPYPCPTARLAGAQDCDPPHPATRS